MTRYIAPLIFGLIGAGILIWLGTWQLQRLSWKEAMLSQIEARISGPAAPLPATPVPETDRYQPVDLTGTIEPGELHVLVSIKQVGAGYRLVVPFLTDDGRRVLLDRGFVPTEARDTPRPAGAARVSGNLHWPDDRTSATPQNDVPGNIWFARDVADMAKALNTEPLLIVARQETPPPGGISPVPVDTSGIPNDHLQYAITWYLLAAVWLGMTGFLLWRMRTQTEG
ncbi:MAG: SURF1 family protein [Roseivivax sp.]|nr:SURF1 family protein [Roseivivax sp.]